MAVVFEVVVGQFAGGLGEDEVGEGSADIEDDAAFLIVILRVGLGGGGDGVVDTPATLLAALEEPGELDGVGIRVGWIICGERDIAGGDADVGIGADGSLGFQGLDGIEILTRGEQGGVLFLRDIHGLLHGQGGGGRRGLRELGIAAGEGKAAYRRGEDGTDKRQDSSAFRPGLTQSHSLQGLQHHHK